MGTPLSLFITGLRFLKISSKDEIYGFTLNWLDNILLFLVFLINSIDIDPINEIQKIKYLEEI